MRVRTSPARSVTLALPMSSGHCALLDLKDMHHVAQYKWATSARGYVQRRVARQIVLLHRQIMCPPQGLVVDHVDGNPLNNTRANLRVCTQHENMRNMGSHKGSVSKFKGVYLNREYGKWYAQIWGGEKRHLGWFTSEEEAARAYDKAALRSHGEFARLNFPEERANA